MTRSRNIRSRTTKTQKQRRNASAKSISSSGKPTPPSPNRNRSRKMHLARNYLGTEGLDQSFQGSFPETVQCKCGGNTRIALVICEEGGLGARTPENRRDNPKRSEERRVGKE